MTSHPQQADWRALERERQLSGAVIYRVTYRPLRVADLLPPVPGPKLRRSGSCLDCGEQIDEHSKRCVRCAARARGNGRPKAA